MVNYFSILEVTTQATAEEIKLSYRRLAKNTHPDRNPGDSEADAKYKQIVSAYEVLSDDTKRIKHIAELIAFETKNKSTFETKHNIKKSTEPVDYSKDPNLGNIITVVPPPFDDGRPKNKNEQFIDAYKKYYTSEDDFLPDIRYTRPRPIKPTPAPFKDVFSPLYAKKNIQPKLRPKDKY